MSSLSAEVRAQGTIKVGYYDMVVGAGVAAEQEAPIIAAGFTPVRLLNVTAADLAGINVLFVQNQSNTGYGMEYFGNRTAVQNAVSAGMVLVIHDRAVGPATTRQILPPIPTPAAPGGSGVLAMRVATGPTSTNIDVSDLNTLVAGGPGGMVTSTNLDNGNASNQGWGVLSSVPTGRKGLLHTGAPTDPNKAVTFSYPFGNGFVVYSTIPLDFYLKGSGNNPPRDNFKNIYAPNVLAYAASLRSWSPALTVEPATGQYGGATTLTATLKSGSTGLAGMTIDFSLNGDFVDSATTDSSGTATLTNASLGATLDAAIAAGTYADGASASFAGAGLFTAASGTATLTVDQAPATIEVVGGMFVYAGAPHAATGSVTGVFDESLGTPTFTYTDANDVTSESAPVNVGTYVITATSTETDNYLSTTVSSSTTAITITPAGLTVTANDKNRLYGGANPTFDGTIVGIQGQDNITASYATEATSASPVGTYDIVPTLHDPDGRLANYETPTVVNGVLTIDPAPLTVTADNKERLIGTPNSALTVTYAGLVNGDTPASLDVQPTVTTTAVLESPEGTYPIVVSGALDSNYTITHVNGALTVSPQGRLHGAGFIDAGSARNHFVFEVREGVAIGERGAVTLRIDLGNDGVDDDLFVSQGVTSVILSDNPDFTNGVDTVVFTGVGEWNGADATFEARSSDVNEPGIGRDTFALTIHVGGSEVAAIDGLLAGGNVQSNRLPGR